MNDPFSYPALYETASQLSAESQKLYLRLVGAEYFLLFVAAVLSMSWTSTPVYFAVYTIVLLCALTTLIGRNYVKPEQNWYRGRALAESIKTSCWRFCMRAEPFGNADRIETVRADFWHHLASILKSSHSIGAYLPARSAAKEQLPQSMQDVRAMPLSQRRIFYLEYRINDQRQWYVSKAEANRMASRKWVTIGIGAYAVAICLAIARIINPSWQLWPIDPVLVIASAILGWTQIKKFNELASSYTLTAHEIGLIEGKIHEAQSDEAFSDFVNDAEQAFSREHTQWAARQQA